jgi:hypothetical protein
MNCLSIFLVSSRSSSTPLYPRSDVTEGARPNSFSFCCFHLWTHNWVHQGAWGCIKKWHTFMICHKMLITSIGLKKKNHPQEKKWTPSIHMMTNSYTYFHNGLSPSPSMLMTNKTLHDVLVHLASNVKKMPSRRLSINSNRQNTQCLALLTFCHEAWPMAYITFTGEFCQKKEFKNWKFDNVVNLEIFNC